MSLLKKGDTVIVTAGGNGQTRPNKGQKGAILRFIGKCRSKVVVEGLAKVTRHYKARGLNRPAGKVTIEAPIHISNVRYFAEKAGKGVTLCAQKLKDGTKVRGYKDPKSNEFVQI